MSGRATGTFDAVLFDLDGTLVDTAPDMVAVLAGMRADRDLEPLPYDLARSHVSRGALALVRLGFPDADETSAKALHQEFLDRYEKAVCVHSALFPGLDGLLDRLEAGGRPWGIVTNKPGRMTDPLLEALGIRSRAACAISGDALPQRKPHPAPLLHASREMGVPATRMIYAGDTAGDIQAGRAAGMLTIAATYGYVTADDDPGTWEADLVATDTMELAHFLLKAVNLDT